MLRDNFPCKIVFLDRLTACTSTWTGSPLLRSILELDLPLRVQFRTWLEIFRKFSTTSTHTFAEPHQHSPTQNRIAFSIAFYSLVSRNDRSYIICNNSKYITLLFHTWLNYLRYGSDFYLSLEDSTQALTVKSTIPIIHLESC